MPTPTPCGIRRYRRLLERKPKPKAKAKANPSGAITPLATLLRDHGNTMQPIMRWMYRWRC